MARVRLQAQFSAYPPGVVEQLLLVVEISGVTTTGNRALIVDRSGSMGERARWQTVLTLLRALEESRSFVVYAFNDNVERCGTFGQVLGMRPAGATNQAKAIRAALRDEATSIVLVTDGHPEGVSEKEVLAACREVEDLYVIGISPDEEFERFLRQMAGSLERLTVCTDTGTIVPIARSLYGTTGGGAATLQPYESVTIERVIQLYPSTQEVDPFKIPMPAGRTQFLVQASGAVPEGERHWMVARLTVEGRPYSLAVPVGGSLGEEAEAITAAADKAELSAAIQNKVPREVVLPMAKSLLVSDPMSVLAHSIVEGVPTPQVEAVSVMSTQTQIGG